MEESKEKNRNQSASSSDRAGNPKRDQSDPRAPKQLNPEDRLKAESKGYGPSDVESKLESKFSNLRRGRAKSRGKKAKIKHGKIDFCHDLVLVDGRYGEKHTRFLAKSIKDVIEVKEKPRR